MRIVSIFAEKLFAFHYKNEKYNELSKLLNEWNDTLYLYNFVKENKNDIPKSKNSSEFIKQIIEDANQIESVLKTKQKTLDIFFTPLHNQEYKVINLSKKKRKKKLFEDLRYTN